MAAPDPESISLVRVILASAVVLGLLALMALVLKYFAQRGFSVVPGARRMQVVETLSLDMRRRLVIVRCDDKEHMLLLGGERDIVIESSAAKSETGTFGAKDTR